MEIEEVVILALNQPRSFTEWLGEATMLRNSEGNTLSRTTFSKIIQKLVAENVVTEKRIDGRKKEFTINRDNADIYKWIEKIESDLLLFMNDIKQGLLKMETIDQDTRDIIVNGKIFHMFLRNLIHDIFLIQKKIYLYKTSNLYSKANMARLANCIKISDIIIQDCFKVTKKIGDNFFFSIYMSEHQKINNESDLKHISEYANEMEKIFRDQKTKSKTSNQRILKVSKHR